MFKQGRLVRDYPRLGYTLMVLLKKEKDMPQEMTNILNTGGFKPICLDIVITSDGINFSRTEKDEFWLTRFVQSKFSDSPENRNLDETGDILCVYSHEEVTDVKLYEKEGLLDGGEDENYGLWVEIEVFSRTTNELAYMNRMICLYELGMVTPTSACIN